MVISTALRNLLYFITISLLPTTTMAHKPKHNDHDHDPNNPFGSPTRHTTTHDSSTGFAIFAPPILIKPQPDPYGSVGMVVHDLYKTFTTPFNMTAESDISLLQSHPQQPAGETLWFPSPGETLVRYCDWAPGQTIDFHRTETIDFGVVMEGEMELTVGESKQTGEKRLLKKGDVVVQRGTLHAWENLSKTKWSRVVFFLVGAAPVVVNGEEKGEVLPWSKK
ncbi:hypothetical protein QBC35DRAFT_437522 [Podospora australis]|uniref:Cupin type-2 domain-containing protein n=1 Tax=Podospora australis TaxID=1536484 RepID=A0AAN7AH27_9PEZI|nr:hypothetical protein QBC35DRAFT_437522 [Podospora australis]